MRVLKKPSPIPLFLSPHYTTQGDIGSINTADYAKSYTLPGGSQILINPQSDPKPITIDKSYTQITLHALDASNNYYFVATTVDKQVKIII